MSRNSSNTIPYRLYGMYNYDIAKKIISFGDYDIVCGCINKVIIQKSLNILSIGKSKGFNADAYPLDNCGIGISFYKDDYTIEISIDTALCVYIELQKGKGVEYDIIKEIDNADYGDITNILIETMRLCNTQEYSTTNDITILPHAGLEAFRYLTQAQHLEAGVPLYSLNVYPKQGLQFALISENSTKSSSIAMAQ